MTNLKNHQKPTAVFFFNVPRGVWHHQTKRLTSTPRTGTSSRAANAAAAPAAWPVVKQHGMTRMDACTGRSQLMQRPATNTFSSLRGISARYGIRPSHTPLPQARTGRHLRWRRYKLWNEPRRILPSPREQQRQRARPCRRHQPNAC